ncbi:MAG: hypothetical protein IJD82_03105, partial [Clostridia bacterium]|nr:hypothetical protein [Clostridia bacterium]
MTECYRRFVCFLYSLNLSETRSREKHHFAKMRLGKRHPSRLKILLYYLFSGHSVLYAFCLLSAFEK